jgi:hypothetical protein
VVAFSYDGADQQPAVLDLTATAVLHGLSLRMIAADLGPEAALKLATTRRDDGASGLVSQGSFIVSRRTTGLKVPH